MSEHDDPDDRLRQEFQRQDPHFDLHSFLPTRVATLIRRRRRRRLVVTVSVMAAVIAAVAVPLANLRSSPQSQPTNPVIGNTSTTSVTSVPPVPTTVSPSTSVPAVPRSTTVKTFDPWTAAGTLDPSFHVLGHLSGSCFVQLGSPNANGQTSLPDSSIGDPNDENAWRCSTDQGIYDPCFAPAGRTDVTELACAVAPYLSDGIDLLTLTQPIPTSSNGVTPSGTWPLVLVLQNGDQCEIIQGTAIRAGFNYGCTNGNASNPSPATQPWTVTYLPNGSDTSVTMTVTTVWQ